MLAYSCQTFFLCMGDIGGSYFKCCDLSDLTSLFQFPGYDVEAVLGKEVGPIPVYVRVITRKPALWMGLEEICL